MKTALLVILLIIAFVLALLIIARYCSRKTKKSATNTTGNTTPPPPPPRPKISWGQGISKFFASFGTVASSILSLIPTLAALAMGLFLCWVGYNWFMNDMTKLEFNSKTQVVSRPVQSGNSIVFRVTTDRWTQRFNVRPNQKFKVRTEPRDADLLIMKDGNEVQLVRGEEGNFPFLGKFDSIQFMAPNEPCIVILSY